MPIVSANDEDNLLIQGSDWIDINAYHLRWDGERQPVETVLAQADEYLGRPDLGKPTILSNDGASMWRAVIREIQDRMRFDGSQHFEHFDRPTNRLQGMQGRIEGVQSFVPWALHRLDSLGRRATPLEPGGLLSRNGNRLLWNGEPVTLMGFSLYGMLASTRHDLRAYLDVLQDRGVNFTREWCFDQWTALALRGRLNDTGEPGYLTGLCPFEGNSPASLPGQPYDLESLSDAFFTHLREFVLLAWERGIVVQVSLYDRNGLRRPHNAPREPGRWADSPFNRSNNRQELLQIIDPAEHPADFTGTDGTAIGSIHRAYLERVAQELRGFGNVILEIMNEPQGNMPDAAAEASWHDWVARILRDHTTGGTRPLAISSPLEQKVFAGDPASFSAIGSGGTGRYTYRWQTWSRQLEEWVDLQPSPKAYRGHDGPYLDLLATHPEQDGALFRCRVADTSGNQTTSQEARLTVDEEPVHGVWIEFAEVDRGRGLRRPPREPGNGHTVVTEIGERICRRNADPAFHDRIYLRVDDEWSFAGDRPRVDVTIEYFDHGVGFLELQYDGRRSSFSTGQRLRLGNTGTWKSFTWKVFDAHFANRQNHGADFRIFRNRGAVFFLAGVNVDATPGDSELAFEGEET